MTDAPLNTTSSRAHNAPFYITVAKKKMAKKTKAFDVVFNQNDNANNCGTIFNGQKAMCQRLQDDVSERKMQEVCEHLL